MTGASRRGVSDVLPLTGLQRGLLYLARRDGSTDERAVDPYTIQLVVDGDGPRPERLHAALDAVLARHDVLRAAVRDRTRGEPVAVVPTRARVPWQETSAETDDEVEERCLDERRRPFDLATPPLVRALLIRRGTGWRLAITLHHLVVDGWSLGPLLRELLTTADTGAASSAAPVPFRRHLEHLATLDRDAAARRVAADLAGLDEPTRLVPALPDTPPDLPSAVTRALPALDTSRWTLATLLQAAWGLTLARLTGRDDVVFGTTVSGRPAALDGVEEMIGPFVATLPVRVDASPGPDGGRTVADLIDALGARGRSRLADEQADLATVSRLAGIEGEPFDTLLVVENVGLDPSALAALAPGLGVREVGIRDATHYPVSVVALPAHGDAPARLRVVYRPDALSTADAEVLADRVLRVLTAVGADPARRLVDIEVTDEDERHRLVVAPNTPAPDEPHRSVPTTWPALFARAAALDPAKPAVRDGERTVTWAELEEGSGRLARALVARGAGPGAVVGVALPRTVDLVVALTAVLRSGSAYLALDLDYPADRLALMVREAEPVVVITDGSDPGFDDVAFLSLDASNDAPLARDGDPLPEPHPDDAAYLIFTSGSTGRPKGVVVPHAGVADLVATATDPPRLAVTPDSRVAMFASVSFDLAFFEMSMALCVGGTCVLVPTALRSPDHALAAYLRDEGVTHAALPPSVSGALPADAPLPEGMTILVGTEAVPPELVARWGHTRRLFDAYGPTEVTVNATLGRLDPESVRKTGAAPIGRVDVGGRAYVLDRRLRPVPDGVVGELYLAGAGLARGYLDRPDLTAERFLADPFGAAFDEPGARMYRTGDLVRRRPRTLPSGEPDPWPGELDYLGRADEQVSLRGFRIEPGEVSAVLAEDPAVTQALVVVRRDGGRPQLVGYVTGRDPDPAALRRRAAERLPEHMIPAAVVVLDAFPVTANNKIDRATLPAPAFKEIQRSTTTAGAGGEPTTPAEHDLVGVVADVLELDTVGVDDDFFALGGDSIVALALVTRARRAGWTVTPRQVVERRTARELAAVAVRIGDDAPAPVDDGTGTVALLPVARAWLARCAAVGGPIARYHQRVVLTVPAGARVVEALDAVLARHDLLRARLVRGEEPMLEVPAAGAVTAADVLRTLDRDAIAPRDAGPQPPHPDDHALDAAVEDAVARLDPEGGRMLAATLVGDRLVLAAHHLVVDAVSWRVLTDDLRAAHAALAAGHPPALDPVPTSFRTWTADLPAAAAAREPEQDHWRTTAPRSGDARLTTTAGAPGTVGTQSHHHVTLPPEVTGPLLGELPASVRGGVDDVLVAAVLLAVTRHAGGEGLVVDRERYGREVPADGPDLSRTVGWFTVVHPVRLALPEDPTPDRLLKAVKEQLRATPGDGAGYGLRGGVDAETPELLVNYLGRTGTHAAGPFAPAPEAPAMSGGADPGMPLAHPLEVNARTEDRDDGPHLVARWSFDTTRLDAAAVEALADAFTAACRELVAARSGIGGATPSDFPTVALTQDDVDALTAQGAEDVLAPAPLAEGLLATAALTGDDDVYAVALEIELSAPLTDEHRAALERAATALVARHDALRETFPQVSSGRWVTAIGAEPRSALWSYRTTPQGLVLSAHHAILDGWSTPVLVREWFALWTAALAHPDATDLVAAAGLGPTHPHRAHLARLAARAAGPEGAAARAAWAEALAGLDGPTLLAPAGSEGPAEAQGPVEALERDVDPELASDLQALARSRGVTLATLLQVAWALVLARSTGRDDVVLGQTVSGRPPEVDGVDTAVGLYITTVPVRVRLDDDEAVADLAGRVQGEQAALAEHAEIGLPAIQRAAPAGSGELFDTLLVVENYPLDPSAVDDAAPPGLHVTAVRHHDAPHYPASLVATPGDGRLHLALTHRPDVADGPGLLDRLLVALTALARTPDETVGALDLLDDAARAAALAPGPVRSIAPTTLTAMLEAGLAAAPDAVAVVTPTGETLTRGELDGRSAALAAGLAARGIGRGDVVGVALPRSAELIVALVGVLRAGAAYLPLDPDYPADRVAFMLADSGAKLVLDGSGVASQTLNVCDATPLPSPPDPADAAYVLYTSGSTGRPKGVVVTHEAIVNRLVWMQDRFGLGPADAVLQKTPSSFDVSVWEFFWPLVDGARLVLAEPGRHGDPEHLAAVITAHGVTTMHFVPSMLRPFLDHVERTDAAVGTLRRIVCSGEGLPPALATRARTVVPHAALHNLYGPTEAAVDVTATEIPGGEPTVPIGAPVANTGVRVLDHRLRPVAPGVTGELYLTGVQLARGYLGRPALTAARFVADPDGPPGTRMYRTGDRARRRPPGDPRAGELDHLGRVDDQVKIRGFRVELGEVEAALAAQPGVGQAVASVRTTPAGAVRLVAHVVPAPGADIDRDALLAGVADRLPEHMVPRALAVVDAVPLSPSGKVDRGALPDPTTGPDDAGRGPAGAVEASLAGAVGEVLGVDAVPVDADFLALGGDSILAIAVVARARAAGVVVTPRQVLQQRTVAALAAVAGTPTEQPATATDPDDAPLLPVAQALVAAGPWRRFHQWRAFVVEGDTEQLRRTLTGLLARHPALSVRVDLTAHRMVRTEPGEVALRRVDAGDRDLAAVLDDEAARAADRLDPERGHVLEAVHVVGDGGGDGGAGRLVLVAHHVAVDAVSWQRLARDLTDPDPAPAPGYLAHARRLAEGAAALRDQLPGWAAVLRRDAPALPLRGPLDPTRDVAAALHRRERRIAGAAGLTAAGALVGGTGEDVVLAALALAAGRVGRGGPLVVEVEGHGRGDGGAGSDAVGWFTTVVPVRVDLRGLELPDPPYPPDLPGRTAGSAPSMVTNRPFVLLARVLRRVVTARHGLPGPDSAFGVLRHLDDEGARVLGALPPPEVVLNHLGRAPAVVPGATRPGDPAPEAPGLHGGGDPDRPTPAHLTLDTVLEGDDLVVRAAWPGPTLHDDDVDALLDALADALPALAALPGHDLGVLANPTPAAVTAPLDEQDLERVLGVVAPARVVDVLPPAPLAEGLMLRGGEGSDPYTIQLTLPLSGDLDDESVGALGEAVTATVARHDALRTVLPAGADGRPLAVVLADPPHGAFRVVELDHPTDARGTSGRSTDTRVPLAQVRADDRRTFDLARGPLLRATLVRGADRHHLVLTVHHVAVDGWSMPILVRDLLDTWARRAPARPAPAHRDHLARLAARDPAEDLDAWREHLAGLAGPTLVAPQDVVDDPVPARTPVTLDDRTRHGLRALARRRRVTPATLLQVAWGIVLGWATGTGDVVLLQTVSGRGGEDTGTVGLFIDTVPVRVRPAPSTRVGTLLEQVRDEQAALADRTHVGLARITRAAGHTQLADTLLVVENYPVDGAALAGPAGIGVGRVAAEDGTHYPLCVVAAGTDGLDVHVAHHLDDAEGAAWAARLARVLTTMADGESLPVGRIDPLGEAERRLVVHDWNDTAVDAGTDPWPTWFAAQVATRPDAPAVVGETPDGTVRWTYRELDARTAAIAAALAARGSGPEDVVGVALPRTPDLVAGLAGVLRAGTAYLPLDPDYPADRLRFTAADAGVRLVVTTRAVAADLPLEDVELLCVEDLPDAVAPTVELSPDHAAYVIHTSGSTGRPKGVVVPHRVVPSLIATATGRLGLRPGARVLQFASPGFDVAFWELTMALGVGATLVVAPSRVRLPDHALTDFLAEHDVGRGDVMILPPALVAALPADAALPEGAVLLVGTEAVPPAVTERWAGRLRVFNAYGPTEVAVNSTLGETDPTSGASGRVPIGVPDPNTRALVLDPALRPVPPGGVGELYLGGAGLARGYLGRPDLTAERFVADPFADEPGARLYRTGDVVRRLPDGRLDHLGRADDQVKIRGHRIELGEVAAAVAGAPGVARAVADTRPAPGGTRRLVAWLVLAGARRGTSLDVVRRHLTSVLPAPMVPADLVVVDGIPTLPSGKTDRAALPEPPSSSPAGTPPRDDAERAVAQVYADVLDLDAPPDVHAGFADLGGHSLLLAALRTRLRERLGVTVSVGELLRRPSAAEVAELVRGRPGPDDGEGGAAPRLVPLRRAGGRPVLLLPGAGGVALPFGPLAGALPADRAVWALQAPELADASVAAPDLGAAVADVLARIDELGGVVDLVGWSYGGVLAQAVAASSRGRVASLVLLDAWPGAGPSGAGEATGDENRRGATESPRPGRSGTDRAGLGPATGPGPAQTVSDGQGPAAAFLGGVLGVGPVEDPDGLAAAVAARPDLAALYPPPVLAGAVRHVEHARAHLAAHTPRPLPTDARLAVTVVVAAGEPGRRQERVVPDGAPERARELWAPVLPADARFVTVDATHLGLLRPGAVERVAEHVHQTLTRALDPEEIP
ncbi:non-ribosomal peptide synthetase [Actinomycetospora sp. TBRC 11914]|uniref:non-ribosomal peptide synthetase n=1 Tax=Actinomycetospora sp. TBRC 11914 TaxID=2729387 RepID=UPI00145E3A2A|nr:non-ribosomal peptide synthetase [Actinomycetospora sp. TBRC 11914]NMO90448.1 amino acid adenylation domain-containing protein [Actinomycetospora sp. TBRC 11914]